MREKFLQMNPLLKTYGVTIEIKNLIIVVSRKSDSKIFLRFKDGKYSMRTESYEDFFVNFRVITLVCNIAELDPPRWWV